MSSDAEKVALRKLCKGHHPHDEDEYPMKGWKPSGCTCDALRDALAEAAKKERAWLLSECEPHKQGVLTCVWRGTRAEAIEEHTNGSCPECGAELNEASQLRDRQKGLR